MSKMKSTLVKPVSTASNNPKILLSSFSHMIWFLPYLTRYLFYKPHHGFSFETIVTNLKHTLAAALEQFYPLAGRINLREDGLMEVVCNGEGVLFIQSESDLASPENYQADDILQSLAQTGGYALQYPWQNIPLLIVQVTLLRTCNWISMSFRYNHQIIDGGSLWHFVRSWAELSCGKNISLPPLITEPPPCISPVPPREKSPRPELPSDLISCELQSLFQRAKSNSSPCSRKRFRFSKGLITRMKGDSPGFTTFQLLTSHIWRRVTAARRLGEGRSTGVTFPVNCRGRLKSVPVEYFGEAAITVKTSTTVGELLGASKDDYGAELLRKRIGECTEETVSSYSKLGGMDSTGQATVFYNMRLEEDLNVSSSFYFPIYQDFGFGKPTDLAMGNSPLPGQLSYFPGLTDGDVEAFISLESEAMERLLADETFLHD